MEHVAFYMHRLPPHQKATLAEQVARVGAHARKETWDKAAVEFFSEFMDNSGLVDDGEDSDAWAGAAPDGISPDIMTPS